MTEGKTETLNISYVMWLFDNVIRMINAIGRQASTLIGFDGLMMTIILATMRLFSGLQDGFLIMIIIAITLFFLSAILCAFVMVLTTGWALPIVRVKIAEEDVVMDVLMDCLMMNRRYLEKFGLMTFFSLLMTLIGIGLLALVIINSLLSL